MKYKIIYYIISHVYIAILTLAWSMLHQKNKVGHYSIL